MQRHVFCSTFSACSIYSIFLFTVFANYIFFSQKARFVDLLEIKCDFNDIWSQKRTTKKMSPQLFTLVNQFSLSLKLFSHFFQCWVNSIGINYAETRFSAFTCPLMSCDNAFLSRKTLAKTRAESEFEYKHFTSLNNDHFVNGVCIPTRNLKTNKLMYHSRTVKLLFTKVINTGSNFMVMRSYGVKVQTYTCVLIIVYIIYYFWGKKPTRFTKRISFVGSGGDLVCACDDFELNAPEANKQIPPMTSRTINKPIARFVVQYWPMVLT